jgi:glucosamine 6-phosphate synthetase-like amidotransferase/phosphosugar isomerase protein
MELLKLRSPLKVELIKRGYVFHSDTDTDYLESYEEVQKE